jgi:hypothetical protein
MSRRENRWSNARAGSATDRAKRSATGRVIHESIQNLTPADVYFGRGQTILKQRERIKLKTMETRRLQYCKHAA